MTVIDLTHTITPGMPVYPGTEPPSLQPASTLARDGFRETLLTLYSHTGTHMDAPAHLLPQGAVLDSLDAGAFVGRGAVVDVSSLGAGGSIGVEHIQGIQNVDFLLFYTRWSQLWGSDAYYGPFPLLSREAAQALAAMGLKGVGVDAISFDAVGDPDLPNHRLLLGAGLVLIENLTGLERLLGRPFTLCALPMKYAGADGAPVRAAALLEERHG